MNKMIKKILKAVTAIMALIFMVSVCSLDNPSWLPTIAMIVSFAWLALYGAANGYFEVGADNVQNR
jgi:hypothetical protein